jgi:type II secretory pathway component GspD/PulD (secretin)
VLTLRDGATLIVGGLQSSRVLETRSGFPILMDIPILGYLFAVTSKDEVKTELYFMVTPEIIRSSYSDSLIKPPGEAERLKDAAGK